MIADVTAPGGGNGNCSNGVDDVLGLYGVGRPSELIGGGRVGDGKSDREVITGWQSDVASQRIVDEDKMLLYHTFLLAPYNV